MSPLTGLPIRIKRVGYKHDAPDGAQPLTAVCLLPTAYRLCYHVAADF